MLIFDWERLEDGELHDGRESGVCCDSGAQLVLVDDLTGAAAPELLLAAAEVLLKWAGGIMCDARDEGATLQLQRCVDYAGQVAASVDAAGAPLTLYA